MTPGEGVRRQRDRASRRVSAARTQNPPPSRQDLIVRFALRALRNREATAYHEAGHVAAAWSLLVPIHGAVTIKPELRCWGLAGVGRRITSEAFVEAFARARSGLPPRCSDRRLFEDQIIVLYAGGLAGQRAVELGEAKADPIPTEGPERERFDRDLAAEKSAVGEVASDAGIAPMPSDLEQAGDLLWAISSGPEEYDAYSSWLWERTRSLVASDYVWHNTRAVAHALLAHETLGARKARQVIRDAFMAGTEAAR